MPIILKKIAYVFYYKEHLTQKGHVDVLAS